MLHAEGLQEFWTDRRLAVVVTAESPLMGRLLVDLNLSEESPVSVSESRLALALWGEELSTYLRWRMDPEPGNGGA